MIVTPVRKMCGSGLISGFASAWSGEPKESIFKDSIKFSGSSPSNMWVPIDGLEMSSHSHYHAGYPHYMALQMISCIRAFRLPSYTFFSSDETPDLDNLMKKLGIKPLKSFRSYASGNEVSVYLTLQDELHDPLVTFCIEAYNKGLYKDHDKEKDVSIEDTVMYILDYPWSTKEGESDDDDDDDYDYDDHGCDCEECSCG